MTASPHPEPPTRSPRTTVRHEAEQAIPCETPSPGKPPREFRKGTPEGAGEARHQEAPGRAETDGGS